MSLVFTSMALHLIQALVFRKQPVEVIGSLLQNISDVILETHKQNKLIITKMTSFDLKYS